MEASIAKRSIAHSHRTFNSTLAGDHRSDMTSTRRHLANRSGRRLFLFKGSTAKRANVTSTTAPATATVKPQRPANMSAVRRGEVGPTVASTTNPKRSLSSARSKITAGTNRRTHMRSSVSDNKQDSKADNASSRHESHKLSTIVVLPDVPPTEGTDLGANDSNSVRNPTEEYLSNENTLTDAKTKGSKLVSSPADASKQALSSSSSSSTSSSSDNDDDKRPSPNKTIRMAISPPVVDYRKLVYDETKDKWIEHWKVEEDFKKMRKRQKREAARMKIARELATMLPAPARKVKGRSTTRFQIMFPTAIIRGDRRRGFAHKIEMTDPLRIELHKRKAPIVPTYFQQHILQYGKLPFRNNPRPHPIV